MHTCISMYNLSENRKHALACTFDNFEKVNIKHGILLLVLPSYFKRTQLEWTRSEHSSKVCIGNLYSIYGITEFVTKKG